MLFFLAQAQAPLIWPLGLHPWATNLLLYQNQLIGYLITALTHGKTGKTQEKRMSCKKFSSYKLSPSPSPLPFFFREAPLHFSPLISPLLFSVQGLFLLTLTDWLIHWLLYWLTDSLPLVCATQLIMHHAPHIQKCTHTLISILQNWTSVWYINISAFKKNTSLYKYMCRFIKMQHQIKSRFLLISLPLLFTCNF